jgi:hypothetical protein
VIALHSHRAAQLQAFLPLGGARLRVMWVVTRPTPLLDLVDEVQGELARLLVHHDLEVVLVRWMAWYDADSGGHLRADLTVKPREDVQA